MKTVLILRHGKSSWKNENLSDHDRPLKKRGIRDAIRMGELIKEEEIVPDVILCSTAKRAKSTAELAAETIYFEENIQYCRTLYHGSSYNYYEKLASLENDLKIAMVVGHNPGLEELLLDLASVDEWMPTAALAQIELKINSWQELKIGFPGKLVGFWFPRGLDI